MKATWNFTPNTRICSVFAVIIHHIPAKVLWQWRISSLFSNCDIIHIHTVAPKVTRTMAAKEKRNKKWFIAFSNFLYGDCIFVKKDKTWWFVFVVDGKRKEMSFFISYFQPNLQFRFITISEIDRVIIGPTRSYTICRKWLSLHNPSP